MLSVARFVPLIFSLAIAFAAYADISPRENFAQGYALYSSGSFTQAK
jgi:hypothetical protein